MNPDHCSLPDFFSNDEFLSLKYFLQLGRCLKLAGFDSVADLEKPASLLTSSHIVYLNTEKAAAASRPYRSKARRKFARSIVYYYN